MYKPASTGKQGGLLAAINSLTSKWQKRWVWTSEDAIHYAPRRPTNANSEVNTVAFHTILEARRVDDVMMLKKGASAEHANHGWVLRSEKKDILWAAPDQDTRDRFVTFFAKYRSWLRLGQPEEDKDAIDFLRQQLVRLHNNDEREPRFSDTSSQLGGESSAAFELEHDVTRYWELIDEEEVGGLGEEQRHGDTFDGSAQQSALTQDSTQTKSSSPASSPPPSRQPSQVNDHRKEPSNPSSSTRSSQHQQDHPSSVARPSSVATSSASRRRQTAAADCEWDAGDENVILITPKPQPTKTFGDTRKLLEAKIEERKTAQQYRKSVAGLQLSLDSLVHPTHSDSASPSPRAFALLSRRHRVDLTHIATTNSAGANSMPLKFPLEEIGLLSTMLEDVVFLDRTTGVSGSAVGTTDGLMLRCAGDMDHYRFAKATRILRYCEDLHPRGHEPAQVLIEDSDGKQTIFSSEFGAYILVQSVAANR